MKHEIDDTTDMAVEVLRKSSSDAPNDSNLISDDDDDDDESYVPESLRDFLKAADKKLEEDLADFLPPKDPTPLKQAISSDDDDNSNNSALCNELEKAKKRDLERAATIQKELKEQRERERKQKQQKQQKQQEQELDDRMDEEEPDISSPLLDIVHPSADVSESHVKRIAMEGADPDPPSPPAFQPLVNMVRNPSAPSPMVDGNAILNSTMATGERSGGKSAFSPSPPGKVGRKLQMELDAEAQRSSITPLKQEKPKAILDTSMEIENRNNNDPNVSIEMLKEKRKSISEKRQQLKQLQSKSAERRKRLDKLDDQNKKGEGDAATPSNAAAAAANQAAAVVASKANLVAKKGSSAIKTQRKLAVTGPVKALPSPRQPQRQQPPPKRSFRVRNHPLSPQKPQEIITLTQDGGERSVSPLGGHEEVVSPLSSPRILNSNNRPLPLLYNEGFCTSYEEGGIKPIRPSPPRRRRQVTRPDSAFDRLSRPTAASTSGRIDSARKKAAEAKQKQEEEEQALANQRRARNRLRSRMAAGQRKKAKNSSGDAQPVTKPSLMISANERKERVERMEKERLAKLKAKLDAKEERLQQKKKEEAKKNKQRLKQRAAARQNKEQHSESEKDKQSLTIPVAPKFATDSRMGKKIIKAEPVRKASSGKNFGQINRASNGLTIPVAPKFATDRRIGKRAIKAEPISLATSANNFGQALRAPKSPSKRRIEALEPRRLTIPQAPKFATSQRLGTKVEPPPPPASSTTETFGQGLRSSTPPTTDTPEPRRLTIPKAPTFATSQRFGSKAKSTPFASPTKKRRDSIDNISWSSMLRDVSGIGSPVSKAASSIKTGGKLTIPITPQFQPIRKRPLPKSTEERELEEIQYFKDHPFKASQVKAPKPPPSTRSKKPTTKRQLTTPEPFHFHTSSSHKRDYLHQEAKEEAGVTTFKALPMPDFTPRLSFGSKKSPPQTRPLTTPEPFKFHSISSKRSHAKSSDDATEENGTFKALPMPDFKPSRASMGSKKSPPTRSITTPEPFKFSSSRKRDEKTLDSSNKEVGSNFKARPMPNFSANRKSLPKSEKKLTNSNPGIRERKKKQSKFPTGASGLTFQRSFTTSSRLSRPRVVQEPPKVESKPFRARPMPDFVPEVIVTRTPIKGDTAINQDQEVDSVLSDGQRDSTFHARPMPNFDKIDIPVKDKDPTKIRSLSNKTKDDESPVASPFKASPAPKNMLDEPSIPVRRRDPRKLRSPDSVKKPNISSSVPKSPTFRALPLPESTYDDPSPVGKFRSHARSPVTSPPRVTREQGNNVMKDAKARLKDRISKRRNNAAAVKAATPDREKSKSGRTNRIMTSPKAFSIEQVESRLNAHAEKRNENNNKALESATPRKSNSTVPHSIDLPRSKTPQRANLNANASELALRRSEDSDEFHDAPQPSEDTAEKEAALLRETKLALALGIPDGDESSSILQLAQEVQKAAEEELSFHSISDHWSSSLAEGRPHNLLNN